MYLCPICKRKFNSENNVAKHSLQCWRQQNPNYKSTPAPRTPDIINRKINEEVLDFFSTFQGE